MAYCDRCERYFGSEYALDQHLDDSARHNICHKCDRDFATWTGLVQHYVQSPRHFYCQSCTEHFDDDYELEDHYEEQHYYCSQCRKVFDTDIGLQEHNRQSHWYCVTCKRLFNNEHSLRTHLRTSAVHNARTHTCPGRDCNRSFISYADLMLHLESGYCRSGIQRHDVNDLAARIDRGGVITRPDRLIAGPNGSSAPRIMQQHATERSFNGTAYECVLCHRTFGTLSQLNAHLASPAHADRMYRCPVQYDGCGAEFRTLSGLMQHVESESCDVHRFQSQVNRALDNLTSRMARIGFR